jgi:Thioesterase-like superfamily
MASSFYIPDGEGFLSTEYTRGPWDPRYQHAGPPAALMARAIEHLDGGEDFSVSRFTVEVLRSIRVGPLTVQARIVRPGKRVQLAEAVLSDENGEVALARAWRIRRGETQAEATALETPPFAGPANAAVNPEFDPWKGPSYFSAVEWRQATGAFMTPGPSATWMRMRVALVVGEEPSPLTRVLVAADSGNGISMELSLATHVFINTELTVHLFTQPVGEWVCLDARTRIGRHGVGLATSILYDASGRIGTGNQTLLVGPRAG